MREASELHSMTSQSVERSDLPLATFVTHIPGDHIGLATPVPIPNTEVKQSKPMVLATAERVGHCRDLFAWMPQEAVDCGLLSFLTPSPAPVILFESMRERGCGMVSRSPIPTSHRALPRQNVRPSSVSMEILSPHGPIIASVGFPARMLHELARPS